VVDARERAVLLDEGLEKLTAFWGGGFEPRPLQQPRIPIWVAGRWRTRRLPLRRAAAWDGFFPIDLPGPGALATLANEVRELRAGGDGAFDLVIEVSPGAEIDAWESAGATWILTSFGVGARREEVRRVIDAGPHSVIPL
jgi:alkanesulfonate monooxygenase SsuD/methylene tetrahydromethanopterin reductase-like flavin-dependent oxidoreductase (luciferase family)